MTNAHIPSAQAGSAAVEPPELELDVVIEVPRGSFLKRGSIGRIDFVSPFPCPFNYGSVPNYLGLEGDLLDALVLGPRLPVGTRIRVKAWGAVTQTDRGMVDDKLVCCTHPPTPAQKAFVLRFFRFLRQVQGPAQSAARSAGAQRLRWLVFSRPGHGSGAPAAAVLERVGGQILKRTDERAGALLDIPTLRLSRSDAGCLSRISCRSA